MHNNYFHEKDYHTPVNHKRIIWDRLSLGTSIYFKFKYVQILFANRKLALKNQYDTFQWAKSSYNILEYVEDCGGKFHITGFDNIEKVKDEPVVFISNHMGTLETMVFPCLIAPIKDVTFVVKESLTTNKCFGPIMRARNPIAVSRHNSRHDLLKVLNEGKEKLSQGISIVIFPQSTRTLEMVPEKFNSMGIKLAQKSGVKVIPVAIKTDFWANGKLIKDLGYTRRKEPIYIKFGEPIEIKGSGKEEHQLVIDFIQKNLDEWNKK